MLQVGRVSLASGGLPPLLAVKITALSLGHTHPACLSLVLSGSPFLASPLPSLSYLSLVVAFPCPSLRLAPS